MSMQNASEPRQSVCEPRFWIQNAPRDSTLPSLTFISRFSWEELSKFANMLVTIDESPTPPPPYPVPLYPPRLNPRPSKRKTGCLPPSSQVPLPEDSPSVYDAGPSVESLTDDKCHHHTGPITSSPRAHALVETLTKISREEDSHSPETQKGLSDSTDTITEEPASIYPFQETQPVVISFTSAEDKQRFSTLLTKLVEANHPLNPKIQQEDAIGSGSIIDEDHTLNLESKVIAEEKGSFICTWHGCTEDIRSFQKKPQWSKVCNCFSGLTL